MSKFANMKAKKDTVKKFVGGGALIQAGLGAAQTAYGITQLPRARAEFERAKAAAPSLETPEQYYQNYKNAYDSELARMESESIQANLATSIQALQGAGGRALVGGLGASVAQNQAARNAMLQQERVMRLQAGQNLAKAEEAAIGRKETRSQQDIAYANQAYQAALGNIGAGLGAVGEAAMYGAFDDLSANMGKFARNQYDRQMSRLNEQQGQDEAARQRYEQLSLDQSARIRSGFDPTVDLTSGLKRPVVEYNSLGMSIPDTSRQREIDRNSEMAKQRLEELNKPKPQAPFSNATLGPDYSMFEDRLKEFRYAGPTSEFDKSTLGPNERYLNVNGETFIGPKSGIDEKYMRFMRNNVAPAIVRSSPIFSPLQPFVNNPVFGRNVLLGISSMEKGGMMTGGEFNHDTNPIDIVQNGVKVGEATGNEYILNPSQAKKIANESSYAKKLFKRFEKQAKKKK